LFTGLLLLAGVAFYFIFYRRTNHVPPKSFPRRD
jgi:hypothetical protein